VTHNKFNHILGSINALSLDQMRQLRRELDSKLAVVSESDRPAQELAEAGRDTVAEVPPAHKPIWEVAEEIRKRIPAEEWAKLPKDGAEQLDHYIYGSAKRPPAR